MNFLEKLDYLMEERSINKSKLSKLSGVPYTTIDGFYKKGYENTKLSTIRKISEALDVSLDYLFDEGPNEKSSSVDGTNEIILTRDERQLVEDYRTLNEQGQELVRQQMELAVESPRYKKYVDLSNMEKQA